MYNHRITENPVRINPRNTRGANKYSFYTERCNTVKYRNSPFYRGSKLWDLLLKSTIDCETIFEFKVVLKKVEINAYAAQNTV